MKNFCLKFLAFCSFIFLAQIILFEIKKPDIPKNIEVFKHNLRDEPQVIGLGDSSLYFHFSEDHVKTSTYEALYNLLERVSMVEDIGGAFNLELYEAYFRHICHNNKSAKMVLIPINLRSFSQEWADNPMYQFKLEKTLLNDESDIAKVFFTPLSVFKFFEPKTSIDEYNKTPVNINGRHIGKVEDFLIENHQQENPDTIKKNFMFRYMYILDQNHKNLASIRKIIRLSKNCNIRPIFFIAPIDFESGNKHVGNQFEERILENVNIIKNVFEQANEPFLDLSTSLDSSYFYWHTGPKIPNEHLIYEGRLFVATQLYNLIQSEFK